MTNPRTEHATMAKIQKTYMVPEDLHEIIEVIEEKSGATFARVMTAAILSYLYQSCLSDEVGIGVLSIDPDWMRLAVLIERGEMEVLDIPKNLIEDAIATRERYLKCLEVDDTHPAHFIPRLKEGLEQLRERLRGWENAVDDFGGKKEAAREAIG